MERGFGVELERWRLGLREETRRGDGGRGEGLFPLLLTVVLVMMGRRWGRKGCLEGGGGFGTCGG